MAFVDKFGGKNTNSGRRALVLRVIILVCICVIPIAAVIELLDNDYSNAFLELGVLVPLVIALVSLLKANYNIASKLFVVSAYILMIAMSFIVKETGVTLYFRNITYYLLALSVTILFVTNLKWAILGVLATGICQVLFAVYGLLPAGFKTSSVLTNLLTAEIIYALIAFLFIKSSHLSIISTEELNKQKNHNDIQLNKASKVVQATANNMQSMDTLNQHVEKIQDLVNNSVVDIQSINSQVNRIDSDADKAIGAVTQIGQQISNLNSNIQNQVASQEESAAAINQMVTSIETISKSVDTENSMITNLAQTSQSGDVLIKGLLNSIQNIEKKMNDIQQFVSLIDNIAIQTNLLAMNAAIEAAHAGNAGRGFAVVAEEIRKLADNSSKNSKLIEDSVNEIMPLIQTINEEGNKTKESFNNILNNITTSVDSFKEIANAVQEVAAGGKQITIAINSLSLLSCQIKEGGNEIDDAQNTIKTIQDNLKKSVMDLNNKSVEVSKHNDSVLKAVSLIEEIGKEGIQQAEELKRLSDDLSA